MRSLVAIGSLLVCLLVAFAPIAGAATYVVRPDGTGDFPTIQAAIDACINGDIVELTDGTFKGDGNRDISYLGKAITVESQNGPEVCIIDCQGTPGAPHRGFLFDQGEGSTAVLDGVTITGGWAPLVLGIEAGGAIACIGSSPSLESCIFDDNTAGFLGGGIIIWGSNPSLTACVFRGNQSISLEGAGGGVFFGANSSPSFVDCLFADNSTQGHGAGILGGAESPDPSSANIEGCVFVRNHAELGSGGVGIAAGSEASLSECSFRENSAVISSGALGIAEGTISASGCTFVGNTAPQGALCRLVGPGPASLSLADCTAYGSVGGDGAIYVISTQASVVMENTIVAFGVDGPAVGGGVASQYTLSCCDIYGNAGGDYVGPIEGMMGVDDNICEDPLFCNAPDELTICEFSACAPDYSPGTCDLIGALPVGCTCTTSIGEGAADATWGAIKSFYK
jgi:hypothetical protein